MLYRLQRSHYICDSILLAASDVSSTIASLTLTQGTQIIRNVQTLADVQFAITNTNGEDIPASPLPYDNFNVTATLIDDNLCQWKDASTCFLSSIEINISQVLLNASLDKSERVTIIAR